MEEIKKYIHVDKHNESVHFRISKIEDYYSERSGEPDLPHMHDYFTVLLFNNGKGSHSIDFKTYELNPNQVYFISPGQVHQVVEEKQSFGYTIVFSEDFMIKNDFKTCFLMELSLFNNNGNMPLIPLDKKQSKKLNVLCNEMLQSYQTKEKHYEHILSSFLKIFLVQCNKIKYNEKKLSYPSESCNTILTTFKELVENNYTKWHAAKDYANALNITVDHLNRTIKPMINKTTKQYIHSRLEIAAKRMLYFTNLSTKEISFSLGFQEPSNFSTFFKKNAGVSPSQFRSTFS